MKLETFKELINKIKEVDKISIDIYDKGIDLISYDEKYQEIINILLKEIYGEDGYDLISWWAFEDVDKYIWNKNNRKSDLIDIEKFWKYLERHYGRKNNSK